MMLHAHQQPARYPYYLVLFLLVFLSGCVHRAPQPIDDWSQHQARIQKLSHWQLTGKLGVRIPGDNGSASLRWKNAAKAFSLDLSGPFGQGRLLIEGKPGRVTLQQAGEAPLTADSAEELILQTTGWTLPVTQLAYWVRGVPAPGQPVVHLEQDDSGLLSSLKQAGWHIQYTNYSTAILNKKPVQLPGRITAEYGDVRLTLIIRQWQLD